MVPSPKVSELRKQVEESAAKYPMQHLVSGVVVNENGKVVARHSNMFSDDPKEREKAIEENMYRQASFHHQIYTHSLIEPVRTQLNLEHPINLESFMRIVSNNPFVPPGREYIYAQGLKAGMDGEYLMAVHLLIPQVENRIITCPLKRGNSRSATSFKTVRKEIEKVVQESVKRFWSYGFRGADLIVACYGPVVGVFGKYERVEKADGTLVEIPELLELARKAARDAIAGEFRGDNLSSLYYVWANLYRAAEQAWDDARLVVQVGGDAEDAMEVARRHGIFVLDGSKCRLALLADRASRRGLGVDQSPPLIDALHRAMLLWKEEKRQDLVSYLGEQDLLEDSPFWKLAQALFEVLPRDTEDWKLTNALLGERETLRVEAKRLALSKEPLFDSIKGR
jgi:hypothetical protein